MNENSPIWGYGRVGRRIAAALDARSIPMLVVATPDPLKVRQLVARARMLNPDIEIVLRTHSEDESQMLREDGIGTVFFGEEELAKSMLAHVLERFAPKAAVSSHGNT